uniref:Uncharacterized protein n=1 Tax=Anopheles stephensi TaxID=30069 RepID=A0A182YNR6_ANOST
MAYSSADTHDALWKQILENHWKYVESEESMLKIELRHDLEDLIEKRLGKVPPNEKFYLDDTRYAFDSSVAHLDDFSAYKASIGFEAISQYANNLFVKPWRKEYKVIKVINSLWDTVPCFFFFVNSFISDRFLPLLTFQMYSGFYQHEIAANLVNAEKLFQAMGYQLMPNKTLVLDGPICPDQVMNVARDAITAYVECQMMKRIYSELTSLRLSIDWIDIYNFRSYHAADVMQTVKQMALSIQEKHHKKQQAKLRDTYGNNSAPALAPASSCNSCNPYQFHVQSQQPPPPVPAPAASANAYCGAGGGGNGVVVGSSQLYNSAVVAAPCSIHSQHQAHHHQQQQQPPPPPPPPPQQQQQQLPANAYGGAYHHPHHLPPSSHPHHHHHLHHSSYQSFQPPTSTAGAQQQQQQQIGAPPLGTMPHSKSLDHYQDANSAAAAAAAAASAASMYGMNVYMQRHSIDQPYHYTIATPYGGGQAGAVTSAMQQPAYEGGPLDGMLACGGGVAGGVGSSAGVSCGSNNHPYNNVPGSSGGGGGGGGRYPPMPYATNANFPMGMPPGPMFMNGGGQLKHHQNGMVEGCGPGYRHAAMSMGYPSYRNGGMMPPGSYYHQPPMDQSSLYGGTSIATQTAGYGGSAAQPGASILSSKKKMHDDYDIGSSGMRRSNDATLRSGGGGCAKKLDRYHKNSELLIDYESDMLPEALAERSLKEQQQHHHHHHYLHHQTSRNSRQSDFDSYEEEQLQREQEQSSSNAARRISSKNQDGIGCYETWNYVYQNLEKQGYTKDLGERGDFLVDELGDDADGRMMEEEEEQEQEDVIRRSRRRADMLVDDVHHSSRREATNNASTSTTLRRNHNEKLKAMKPKAADKVDGIVRQAGGGVSGTRQPGSATETRTRHERHASSGSAVTSASTMVQKVAKMSLSTTPTDDLLGLEQNGCKPDATSTSRRNSVTSKKPITPQGSGSSSSTGAGPMAAKETKNNSTSTGILVHNHHQHGAMSSGVYQGGGNAKKKTATFDTGAVTIINPSPTGGSPGAAGAEWNCNFCTYLNPDVKRICDMCSKSRDFRLDGTTSTTSSAAAATSNGTTATCV